MKDKTLTTALKTRTNQTRNCQLVSPYEEANDKWDNPSTSQSYCTEQCKTQTAVVDSLGK